MRDVLNVMSLHSVTIRAIDRSENGQLVFHWAYTVQTTHDLWPAGGGHQGELDGSAWI